MSGDYEQAKLRAWQSEGAYVTMRPLASSWEQRKLGELLLFQNGFNGSSESFGSGIPLISVMDVLDDEFITHETVRGKARLNYEEASRYCVEYGDVLFQRSSENQEDAGTSNVYLDQHVPSAFGGFVIRGKKVDEYNPIFIKYLLGSSFIREQITHRAQGAQHINVSQDTLAGVVLLMPSMREQEAVGLVFLHLANLITLHQCKCQHCSLCGYLSWEQRKWSEYVSISTDMVDPRSGNYGNLPHVGPGNMESFTGRLYDNVNTVKDDALISGKFHFNPGDIIYGKINPQLGKYTYAQFEGLASADAYVLNGKNGLTQEFLFGILQTKAFFDYSVSVSMRSGMPKINRDELNAFEFLAPNESEQRAIGDILLKLDDLITLHR